MKFVEIYGDDLLKKNPENLTDLEKEMLNIMKDC